MPGPVALLSAGAFLPATAIFDRELIAATGQPRPRVVVIPAAVPGHADLLLRAAAMGIAHFSALGAEVEPVLAHDSNDAGDDAGVQAVGEADLVYVCGERVRPLLRVLAGTALGDAVVAAHLRGAVVAGCGAGAAVLARRLPLPRRAFIPFPLGWPAGVGLLPGIAVLADYDAMPEAVAALMALQAPRETAVFGIDSETGVMGRDGVWQVLGEARVTVWRGRHRERFRPGESFRA